MDVTAAQIAAVTGGSLRAGTGGARATSLGNDSRTLQPGACFVALVGGRDGHEFVQHAFARGARVALVTRPVPAGVVPAGGAVVEVDDALAALAALASWARGRLGDAITVGITGSTGKTSTKELAAAALREKFRVHATPASFNAEIGLPITLLGAPLDTEVLVLELGARYPGDLARLSAIARPTIGVVTNVGLAHAEHLGGREGVAAEKARLLAALHPEGLAVVDAGDPATPRLVAETEARVLRVAATADVDAEVRVHSVRLDDDLHPSFVLESAFGSGPIRLSLRGRHHVANAALAATVALVSHVPFDRVAAALARVRAGPGRMAVARSRRGLLVLDDAYNASPSSMAAALDALASLPVDGRRIAVLGEMRELGADSASEHAAVGRLVADAPVDLLITVGPETVPLADAARRAGLDSVVEVADAAQALAALAGTCAAGDALLVKGSRAVGLDAVVRDLLTGHGGPA